MSFLDKIRGRKPEPQLPRGAKVVRRRRRQGGSDVGYWSDSSFYLLDGTLITDSSGYLGSGDTLGTSQARIELEREGYDTSSYTAPSTSSSSYDSSPSYSSYDSDSGRSSYGGGSSYSSGDSGYSSGGSSSGYSSSSDSSSSSSSSDSGSY